MNLVYLKYAVEIARVGSINKAAEKLYVAQPNLSRAIKELEKELGIAIFDRNSKGMVLTPEGERFIQCGKKLLRQIDEVEGMFREEQTKKTTFSISVPRAGYISHAMTEFSLRLAGERQCEIFYKETNAARAVNNILRADYKLGIVRYASHYDRYFKDMLEQKNLAYDLITEFSYVLAMNRDCPLAELDKIGYADLEDYVEIAHADPYVPSVSLADVRKEELPENISRRIFVFERASQLEIMAKNTETFMWVSPTPDETLERFNLVQRACPDNRKQYRDLLIYPKDYHLTRLDNTFIEELYKAKNLYMK